jgi:hypothetical protein
LYIPLLSKPYLADVIQNSSKIYQKLPRREFNLDVSVLRPGGDKVPSVCCAVPAYPAYPAYYMDGWAGVDRRSRSASAFRGGERGHR